MKQSFQRLATTLVVLAWVGAPVLGVLHGVLEEHAYCVEHGALEELSASDSQDAHHGVGNEHERHEGLAFRAAPTEMGHEECAFNELGLLESIELPSAPVSTVLVVTRTGALFAPAFAAPRSEILRNAPKTSPPHALS